MKKTILSLALLLGAGLIAAKADTFGTGGNQFTIDFTTIGNPGNDDDNTGYGSVQYVYSIGTYEISKKQIAAACGSGFWFAGVEEFLHTGSNLPAEGLTWYEIASFVNWLNTSSGYEEAYDLSSSSWSRNPRARYFIPNEDEWYKAAYGKSDGVGYYNYPTGSDTRGCP